jgi:hypothetical protein
LATNPAGAAWGDEFPGRGIQPGDLGGQILVAAGRRSHRCLGAFGGTGQVAGAEPGRRFRLPLAGQPGDLLAQRPGCGEDQAAQRVAGPGAGLDRCRAGRFQRPDRLSRPVAALGHLSFLAGT